MGRFFDVGFSRFSVSCFIRLGTWVTEAEQVSNETSIILHLNTCRSLSFDVSKLDFVVEERRKKEERFRSFGLVVEEINPLVCNIQHKNPSGKCMGTKRRKFHSVFWELFSH